MAGMLLKSGQKRLRIGTLAQQLVTLLLGLAACGSPAKPAVNVPVSPSITPTAAQAISFVPTTAPTVERGPAGQTATPSTSPHPSLAPPTPTSALRLCSPLDIHPLEELPEIVSDPYHPPPPGKEERHHGVDFSYYRRGERSSILGVGVQAVLPGRVAMVLANSFPYGNVVIIETLPDQLSPSRVERLGISPDEALYLLFAHLEESPSVVLGDEVHACQPLGTVGKSGNAGVAHLHLEARIGPPGAVFEGMQFYIAGTTQAERDTYLLWRTSGMYRHFDPMSLLEK